MRASLRSLLPAIMLVPLASCTHAMRVRNLDAYMKTASAPEPLAILLTDRSTTADEHEYFELVHQALATHPAVKTVVVASEPPPDFVPDVTVGVWPRPEYHGSWWNYPITFPGFVLFTHAWNGYVYSADLVTEVNVSANGHPVTTNDIATHYDMRHCSFARGAITSSGWYTPGWGGLNAIIGFFMVPYSNAATPAFRNAVGTAYGNYVANSIVEIATGATTTAGGFGRRCAA